MILEGDHAVVADASRHHHVESFGKSAAGTKQGGFLPPALEDALAGGGTTATMRPAAQSLIRPCLELTKAQETPTRRRIHPTTRCGNASFCLPL